MANENQPQPTGLPMSAMAVTALVLGIIALILSAVPIINNFSAILAVLGVIFAIIGFVGISKKGLRGKPLAIIGLILNILAFVIVIASQSMYSAALDSVTNGPSATGASGTTTEQTAKADYSNLTVGQAVDLDNGEQVIVNSVTPGVTQPYSTKTYTAVSVTYTNNSKSEVSFNGFDWKAQDAAGAARTETFVSGDDAQLNSGTLTAGGTVTGNVYFEGDIVKVLYYGSIISDSATAGWNC